MRIDRVARPVLVAMMSLLSGCITNTLSTQNMQVAPGGVAPAPRAVPVQPAVRLTETALLARARTITAHARTTAGATLVLASPQALAPDCSTLGEVVVKVTSAPEHGRLHIGPGTTFSNYKPGDPPYSCNARRTPATIVTYRADAGYVGDDFAVVQIFFPNGNAPIVRTDISVQ